MQFKPPPRHVYCTVHPDTDLAECSSLGRPVLSVITAQSGVCVWCLVCAVGHTLRGAKAVSMGLGILWMRRKVLASSAGVGLSQVCCYGPESSVCL